MNVASNTPGYPVRAAENLAAWACLKPLPLGLSKGHVPGGKRKHFDVSTTLRRQDSEGAGEPYSASNPCKVKTSGQGASYLGFYQWPDNLRKKQKSSFRGPRRTFLPIDEP